MRTPIRITDSRAAGVGSISVEYSNACPFNADNSRLLLQHAGGFFGLYDGAGKYVRLMERPVTHSSEPRWSRRNPDVMYFIDKNALWMEHPSTGQRALIHVFSEYIASTAGGRHGVHGRGESDISEDDGHLVLAGIRPQGGVDVFVYEISTRTKGPVFPQARPFDGLKLTGDNKALVSGAEGVFVLDDLAKPPRRIFSGSSPHAAPIGPYFIVTNSNESPTTLPDFPNGIVRIDTRNGEQLGLLSLPWIDAVHISTAAGLDWCAVGSYGAKQPSGKVYKVMIDGSGAEMLADGINSYVQDGNYTAQPKASVSRDGSRLAYTSDKDGALDVWMLMLDGAVVVPPAPVQPPEPQLREIDFTADEGRKWQWHFEVINGKMTVKVYDER